MCSKTVKIVTAEILKRNWYTIQIDLVSCEKITQ